MRVLFCTTGGLGHLLPLRPLAAALRDRGHDIAWATAPDALPALEGLGCTLFAVGPTFEASRLRFRAACPEATRLTGEPLADYTFPRLFGAVLAPAMLDGIDAAARHWRPDFVVHEPAALAVPLVCSRLGLRHVVHGYGLRPPAAYLAAAMSFFGPHWRSRGLEPPADGGLYRHLGLDIAPEGLQPGCGLPAQAVVRCNVYRPASAPASTLPPGLGAALHAGAQKGPRIYVTFGTVYNHSPALTAAARAAAQLGATVCVTVGANGDPGPLAAIGPHVHVHRFVEQCALLPHCDAVVSHGGAGTTLGAAAHALPHLVLPQAADHFRNARAIAAAHAGCTVEAGRQHVDGVAAALSALLVDRTLRAGAQALAAEMGAMPDAAAAADRLERWQIAGRRAAG